MCPLFSRLQFCHRRVNIYTVCLFALFAVYIWIDSWNRILFSAWTYHTFCHFFRIVHHLSKCHIFHFSTYHFDDGRIKYDLIYMCICGHRLLVDVGHSRARFLSFFLLSVSVWMDNWMATATILSKNTHTLWAMVMEAKWKTEIVMVLHTKWIHFAFLFLARSLLSEQRWAFGGLTQTRS